MKRFREEAYLLRTQPLGDADLIVSLLTAEGVLVRAVAPAARRSRRRFGGALEPWSRVVASWSAREGRELARLEHLELVRSYAAVQAQPEALAACAVVAEVTEVYGREGPPEPRAFRLVGAVLEALAAGTPPALLLRYFEYWTLRLHGLLPDTEVCAACGRRLEPRAARVEGGSLCCGDCSGRHGLPGPAWSPAGQAFIAQAAHRPPHEMAAPAELVRPGGPLEALLRGALERYAERRFATYRHFRIWSAEAPLRGAGA